MADAKEALLFELIQSMINQALQNQQGPLHELAFSEEVVSRTSQLYHLGLAQGLALASLNARWILAYAEGSEILDSWTKGAAAIILHDLQEAAFRRGLVPLTPEVEEPEVACTRCGCCPARFRVACLGCDRADCTTEAIPYCQACLVQMSLEAFAAHREEREQRQRMKEREN